MPPILSITPIVFDWISAQLLSEGSETFCRCYGRGKPRNVTDQTITSREREKALNPMSDALKIAAIRGPSSERDPCRSY
jgi:hypothetical protein